MGIKASNIVVTGQEQVAPAEAPIRTKESVELSKLSGSKIVVDGKVKNISKKSAFLLDMLTLDDE
jgi:hypothetical protein